ncbi:trypsin-like peptidase domain-containing protein [Mycolicibacterium sp.]|uniref:trypsin-like serine peptidase n=1 Tax=Mycolicibacterium sp. TaxID=2320850 RepID=UPI001A30F56A|nr:trypsin-like peptidase domain-containing protein [Mycolicibacterium sp.]MBJ7340299.1 trypsin-like peptidase domain-containing protein [Mycolicibacterium sp.]
MRPARLLPPVALAAIVTACAHTSLPEVTAAAPPPPSSSSTHSATATATATVTADPVGPDPRVGAVFLGGNSLHTCTGSVVHSSTGDLILTAAHCMADGFDASFVPGFSESAQPQDFWHIDTVYLDPRWVASQNPLADFAVARVSHQDGGSVEAAAGGGFAIGPSPNIGTDVAVTGYALGVGGSPVGCTARIAELEHGYPSIRCAGLVDGTSGSPWLTGSTVVGITGGLQGGGCEENVSYAAPFDGAITALVTRAEAGGPGDVAPNAFEDDC